MGVNHAGKKKTDRDLQIKIFNAIKAVKEALIDLLGTMFIIYQPQNWYGSLGETASFTVVAMNVSAYRWQYSDDGESWTNSSSSLTGYNTPTITFEMEERHISRYRRCRLTDTDGNYIYTDAVQSLLNEEV